MMWLTAAVVLGWTLRPRVTRQVAAASEVHVAVGAPGTRSNTLWLSLLVSGLGCLAFQAGCLVREATARYVVAVDQESLAAWKNVYPDEFQAATPVFVDSVMFDLLAKANVPDADRAARTAMLRVRALEAIKSYGTPSKVTVTRPSDTYDWHTRRNLEASLAVALRVAYGDSVTWVIGRETDGPADVWSIARSRLQSDGVRVWPDRDNRSQQGLRVVSIRGARRSGSMVSGWATVVGTGNLVRFGVFQRRDNAIVKVRECSERVSVIEAAVLPPDVFRCSITTNVSHPLGIGSLEGGAIAWATSGSTGVSVADANLRALLQPGSLERVAEIRRQHEASGFPLPTASVAGSEWLVDRDGSRTVVRSRNSLSPPLNPVTSSAGARLDVTLDLCGNGDATTAGLQLRDRAAPARTKTTLNVAVDATGAEWSTVEPCTKCEPGVPGAWTLAFDPEKADGWEKLGFVSCLSTLIHATSRTVSQQKRPFDESAAVQLLLWGERESESLRGWRARRRMIVAIVATSLFIAGVTLGRRRPRLNR